ncbi:hypothetical protein I8540_000954 [Clostridium perfringens]|nr:hypothetical protein [Clostridium perfringens]
MSKNFRNKDIEAKLNKKYIKEDICNLPIYIKENFKYGDLKKIKNSLIYLDNKLINALIDKDIIIILGKGICGKIYRKNLAYGVYLDEIGSEETSDLINSIVIINHIILRNHFEKTLFHEIGHFIDNYLGDYEVNDGSYENYKSVGDNIFYKLSKKNIRNNKKSEKANKELFAELFAEYYSIEKINNNKYLKREYLEGEGKHILEGTIKKFIEITS